MIKGKEKVIVTLVVLFLFFSMSIGYAVYTVRTDINGIAHVSGNGEIVISNAIITDYKNLLNPQNPSFEGTRISFDLNFFVARTQAAINDSYYVTYQVTLSNDSVFNYYFDTSTFSPSLVTSNQDVNISYHFDGIELNDVIPAKDSKTFYLTINMVPNEVGNINVSGDIDIILEPETYNDGTVIGSIPRNSTGDLINNDRVLITSSVINTYNQSQQYNIVLTNEDFYLVDSNNNSLGTYTIDANDEVENSFYIKLKPTARFATNQQSINIFLEHDGVRTSMGVVVLTVPKDETVVDLEAPTISDVVGTFQAAKGSVEVSYNAHDNIGIGGYTLEVYKVNGNVETKINTIELGPDVSSYTVTNLEDGSYYFKVIVEDTVGFTAEARSTTKEYDWTMNVVINITQGGPNGTYTVDYGTTYQTTITANNNRLLPNNLTVKMNGVTLNTNQYTYSNNTGQLRIPNVTGDVNVTGETRTGGCLIEGTKVLLANGKYKNIEDIKYDDLLLVWNFDTGKLVKEYPIWIEKEKVNDEYTKITFSDGTSIGVVGSHGFYNSDLKEFVNYEDRDKFHVGSKIIKINNDKLKEVKVKKIEKVKKKIKYYFIASTRYWNIISNNIITTDGYTDISNIYSFNDNMTWINNNSIKDIDYTELKDVLPYYLYKGFRAGELAVLLNSKKSDMSSFKQYVNRLITSNNMILEPISKNNNRYWKVSNNIESKLVKEGDYYVLPNIDGKWYSTSENKYYKSKDKVQIWTGMHFEIVK